MAASRRDSAVTPFSAMTFAAIASGSLSSPRTRWAGMISSLAALV